MVIYAVKYSHGKGQWKIDLRKDPCIICASTWRTVVDHCHEHGWVRGVLCQGCNHRMGCADAGKPGYAEDERHVTHRLRCAQCAHPDATVLPETKTERRLRDLRELSERLGFS